MSSQNDSYINIFKNMNNSHFSAVNIHKFLYARFFMLKNFSAKRKGYRNKEEQKIVIRVAILPNDSNLREYPVWKWRFAKSTVFYHMC